MQVEFFTHRKPNSFQYSSQLFSSLQLEPLSERRAGNFYFITQGPGLLLCAQRHHVAIAADTASTDKLKLNIY